MSGGYFNRPTGINALEAEMRDRLAAKNAEIERLQAISAEQLDAIAADTLRIGALKDINAELVEFLEAMSTASVTMPEQFIHVWGGMIRAAIAKAKS